jgi:hypothetical protein
MSGIPVLRTVALVASAALLVTALAAPVTAAKPRCGGKVATQVGTARSEVIRGTRRADVIVAKGGNDIILGLGGNDLICGSPGHDRLVGGPGDDLLLGQAGRDKLFGGPARDRLLGGPSNDRFDGGSGNDACLQGPGVGPRIACERPVVPPPPPPPGPKLLPLTGILAVAYSDIDGLEGYSSGDVLIARLIDTDGNGADAGDTIEMGRYPTDFASPAFGDWTVKSHTVASISAQIATDLVVKSTGGGTHEWRRDSTREQYYEAVGSTTYFTDGLGGAVSDSIQAVMNSPSLPTTPVAPRFSGPNSTDDAFVDVELNP